ncbi:hypothetical protein M569_07590, partial [Genlisea aurea]
MENWEEEEEEEAMNLNPCGFPGIPFIDVKQELERSHSRIHEFRGDSSWISSPSSCITKNSLLSFSGGNTAAADGRPTPAKKREEHSLE